MYVGTYLCIWYYLSHRHMYVVPMESILGKLNRGDNPTTSVFAYLESLIVVTILRLLYLHTWKA
jgi:hypothetical protein